MPVRTSAVDRGERMHVLGELPDRKRGRFAFRFERAHDAHRARRVAGEPRFRELEDVVAGDVGHRAFDRFVIELAFGQQQGELLDFLPCREQVAFAGSARNASVSRDARWRWRARRAAIQPGSASRSSGYTAIVTPAAVERREPSPTLASRGRAAAA